MWWICLLFAFQPGGAATQPATAPDELPQTQPAVRHDLGPLRVEMYAAFDARYWYLEPPPGARDPEFRMRLRIVGEGIDKAARVGSAIFTEAIDDTGKSLVGENTYTEEERTQTRPLNMTPEQLRSNGVFLDSRIGSPARGAKTLKLRGTARLILAPFQEEVTIDNPLQYVGKQIEHPRLRELGITVRVVPAEEISDEPLPSSSQMITLRYLAGAERVHGIGLHDAWMRPLRVRERPTKTKNGDSVVACTVSGGNIDENTQMVLKVFPQVEDLRVPIEFDAFPLP